MPIAFNSNILRIAASHHIRSYSDSTAAVKNHFPERQLFQNVELKSGTVVEDTVNKSSGRLIASLNACARLATRASWQPSWQNRDYHNVAGRGFITLIYDARERNAVSGHYGNSHEKTAAPSLEQSTTLPSERGLFVDPEVMIEI